MFRSKRSSGQEESLVQEIERLKMDYLANESQEIARMNDLKSELNAVVHQHEKVNAQHNVLGEAVSQIEKRFGIVGELSELTSEKSQELFDKGSSLEKQSHRMMNEVKEGSEEVNATADVMKNLEL